ncbi:unnamed protein product [Linum trigynum]|uniref:Uncharacterized protein n=1 Tax=Linum trigynum TaxID=586398 RepID=A0AAV2FLA1_9ROSI
MAFRKNRPKSVMVPLCNLPKMDPEEIRQNWPWMDLIVVEELPQAESTIFILQNPRKMAFQKKIAQIITKMPSQNILAQFGA